MTAGNRPNRRPKSAATNHHWCFRICSKEMYINKTLQKMKRFVDLEYAAAPKAS
jgi:hypothetical protein